MFGSYPKALFLKHQGEDGLELWPRLGPRLGSDLGVEHLGGELLLTSDTLKFHSRFSCCLLEDQKCILYFIYTQFLSLLIRKIIF